MKTGRDQVLVKLKNPKIEKRGSIHIDTNINQDQHYINHAEVVATPIRMSKNRYMMIPKHTPLEPYGVQMDRMPDFEFTSYQEEYEFASHIKVMYSEEKQTPYSYSDILQEVEIGDKIYFNWTALANKRNFIKHVDGYQIWRIDYDSIFCALRPRSNRHFSRFSLTNTEKKIWSDAEMIMIGSYSLIEPDMESYDDILHPVYYPLELTGGKAIPRPKSEWLQVKVEPEAKALRGFVRHVGSPFKGDECYVKPGDHILYENGSKLEVMIENKKYYAIRQHRLIGIIEESVLTKAGS